jgi:uncharacterized protein YciI
MYLMVSTYRKPLDEVDLVRADHIAFLDTLIAAGVVVGAGRQEPPVGGVVLLDVATEAEARAIMADDPYVLRGVADYESIGWNPTRGRLAPGATS